MKRLLLTLSLMCFSWGAGANDFGEKNSVLFKYDPTSAVSMLNTSGNPARINDCLKAAQNGFELSNSTFKPEKQYEAIHHRRFLYKDKLYILITFEHSYSGDTRINCHKQTF